MPWVVEIVGFSDRLGYTYCSDCMSSGDSSIRSDDNPAYSCDLCGRAVGGEVSPRMFRICVGEATPVRNWSKHEARS